MKILLISDFFPTGKDLRFSGGVEARTFFAAKHLAKKNLVHVISSRQEGSKKEEKMFGFKVHRVGAKSLYVTGNIPLSFLPKKVSFVYNAFKKGISLDLDIVDGSDFFGHLIAKLISIRRKIPVVYWYPDVFIGQWIKTSGLIAGFAGYFLEKINLILGADKYIAISNQTKNKLVLNNIKLEDITVIPCGVDTKEFRGKRLEKRIKILTISRLVWYKRIKDLILAFALLNAKLPNLYLEIIGRGPLQKKLDQLIKELNLNKKVKILKNLTRKDLVKTIKNSTVFCLPSEVEGFGISVIESAAAGVPYVISDTPVFKEVTENSKGGLLFKVRNISDLADKLETLITNKNLYDQKRQEGLLLARRYSWKKISRQTEEVYKKLLKK